MSYTVRMNHAIITMTEVDFNCPKCGCSYREDDWYKKYEKSSYGVIYFKCRNKDCKELLGVTTNIKGDVVVWLKSEENER